METKADFHCHVTDGYDLVWKNGVPIVGGKPYYGLFQPKGDIAEKLRSKCDSVSWQNQQNTLIGLINFDDNRAQRMMKELQNEAREAFYKFDLDNSLLKVYNFERTLGFLSGQELTSNKGDLLFVGTSKNIQTRDAEDALKEAREVHNALILGAHIGKARSLTLRDVEKYAKYFDAIDVKNDFGIPVYKTSDSHSLGGIFSSYTTFRDLDFSSEEKLKASIRNSLKKGMPKGYTLGGKSESKTEFLRHMASVMLWMGCGKLGLMKRDYQ